MSNNTEIKEGDIFVIEGGKDGVGVRMRLVKYLNEFQAEVEVLSGPGKGTTTVLEKVLD